MGASRFPEVGSIVVTPPFFMTYSNNINQTIKLAIVDDHSLMRKGLKSLFEEFENMVVITEAENGKVLIDSLPEKIPDIVVLDLEMPVMDGIEVTEYLHKNYPKIKILILSMYDDDEFITYLIEKGANGFLTKGGDDNIILAAIYSIMETGYYFDEKVNRALVEGFVEDEKIKPQFRQVNLSERETEIIKLVCKEYTYKEISEKLFISFRTVERHRENMLKKVGTHNTIGLVMFAVKNNLHNKSIRNSVNGIKRL